MMNESIDSAPLQGWRDHVQVHLDGYNLVPYLTGPQRRARANRLVVPSQAYVASFLSSLKEYPQRQKAASFNLDDVMCSMSEGAGSRSRWSKVRHVPCCCVQHE